MLGDDGAHTVRETGAVRLWQHVEHAHQRWQAADRPGWSRLGLAVTPEQQVIYVDEPGNPLAVLAAQVM